MGIVWLLAAQVMAGATSGPMPIVLGNIPICAQLAKQLPIKPPGQDQKTWRLDTRSGLKGLFSSSAITFGTEPVDPNDAKSWQRASNMCALTGKGGQCLLEGPVQFIVRFDEKDLAWTLETGARALIRVEGSVLECEELEPVADNEASVDVR